MKRPRTPLAIGLAALAGLLLLPGIPALAGQQTFSSVSSGKAPVPRPTPTSFPFTGVYLGLYPAYWRPRHCTTGRCTPVKPVRPPRPVPPRP